MLRGNIGSAVIELIMPRARHICDTLGESIGSSVMAQLTDRLHATVLRKGIMWRSGDDRLCLSLLYARDMPEVMRIASYLIRAIEEAPFQAFGYRFHMSAEANIQFCQPSTNAPDRLETRDCRHREQVAASFLIPLEARLSLAAINRIPVHVGDAPAHISLWSPELIRIGTAVELPHHGQVAVEVAIRVLERNFTLTGTVVWAHSTGKSEYEYGIELDRSNGDGPPRRSLRRAAF